MDLETNWSPLLKRVDRLFVTRGARLPKANASAVGNNSST